MLAQALTLGKSEERHRSRWFVDDGPAHDRAVLVADQVRQADHLGNQAAARQRAFGGLATRDARAGGRIDTSNSRMLRASGSSTRGNTT